MPNPKIRLDEVKKVAMLARLQFNEAELETMRTQLDKILDYVTSLEALDVAHVEPTTHAVPMIAPLREDQERTSLERSEVLAQAPQNEAGAFAVPKVLDGDA